MDQVITTVLLERDMLLLDSLKQHNYKLHIILGVDYTESRNFFNESLGSMFLRYFLARLLDGPLFPTKNGDSSFRFKTQSLTEHRRLRGKCHLGILIWTSYFDRHV